MVSNWVDSAQRPVRESCDAKGFLVCGISGWRIELDDLR